MSTNILEVFKKIKAFVFDIDGVLTDGSILLQSDGSQLRKMNIKDGYALQIAVKKGYPIGIISGGNATPAKVRLQKLGIHDIYLSSVDKLDNLKEFMSIHNLKPVEVLYMGDDIPDIEVMLYVGLPCTPFDGSTETKSIAKYICEKNGGQGCVREVIEKTMRIQDQWINIDTLNTLPQDFKW